MTRIKLCGLTRPCDIEAANELQPEYIGFVFAKKSRRYISPREAVELKGLLRAGIKAVGVFVDENPRQVAELLNTHVIDMAQLHGNEDEDYISELRRLTDKPIIKAFRMENAQDVTAAARSSADYVLLDSGKGGTGEVFDWTLIENFQRDFFLAGGLGLENVSDAIKVLKPFGVDVSSGIETDGVKDGAKMRAFVDIVRSEKKGE